LRFSLTFLRSLSLATEDKAEADTTTKDLEIEVDIREEIQEAFRKEEAKATQEDKRKKLGDQWIQTAMIIQGNFLNLSRQ